MKPSDPKALSGTIAVEVNPNAPIDRLELSFAMTGCGLMYSDLSQCPRAELQLPEIHGSVTDVTGASIPNADVALLDLMEQPIERTLSDNFGAFDLHHSISGDYFLVAHHNGFAISQTTIHLAPPLPLTRSKSS